MSVASALVLEDVHTSFGKHEVLTGVDLTLATHEVRRTAGTALRQALAGRVLGLLRGCRFGRSRRRQGRRLHGLSWPQWQQRQS